MSVRNQGAHGNAAGRDVAKASGFLTDGHLQRRIQGLGLCTDWPALGLRKGDRIEPCPTLLDWQSLYRIQPDTLLFWHRAEEGGVRHRNPLFSCELGTSLDCSYAPDTMHTWCLGIFHHFLGDMHCGRSWTARFLSRRLPPLQAPSQDEHTKSSKGPPGLVGQRASSKYGPFARLGRW